MITSKCWDCGYIGRFRCASFSRRNPYRYAGYRYDEVTGLYHLKTRYYNAKVGRFITRDTFHGFVDEAGSLNQYAYTENNPVMFDDSSGNATNPLTKVINGALYVATFVVI
ncbi:MAG TPA: RHS repeat-associated core domain-containing protein, partial [Bacillales bacterium]|nr:RHS repeat-associated core domain-containing protein [Bacillales bacterium]